MSLPYYIERSKNKAKRPKKGQKVTHAHYDLFRGVRGKSSFSIKKVKTEEFKKWLIELYKPVDSITEEEQQEAIDNIVSNSQKIIEEGSADIKPTRVQNALSDIVKEITISHRDNGELKLVGLNILPEYLPEDNNAPQRVGAIAKEFIEVVNKFHQECNSIVDKQTETSHLCISALPTYDKEGNKTGYNWESAKLRVKRNGVFQEEYTDEWMSASMATQAIYELQFAHTDEFEDKLKFNKDIVDHSGEYFSEVLLRTKGKYQQLFDLVSVNASKEAKTVAKEIIPYLETTNSLSKIA